MNNYVVYLVSKYCNYLVAYKIEPLVEGNLERLWITLKISDP